MEAAMLINGIDVDNDEVVARFDEFSLPNDTGWIKIKLLAGIDLLEEPNVELCGYLVYYARDVISGRWPEAEAIIATDRNSAQLYNYFCDGDIDDGSVR